MHIDSFEFECARLRISPCARPLDPFYGLASLICLASVVNQQYNWPAEVIESLQANWAWMQRKLTDNYNRFYWKQVEYMMSQLCESFLVAPVVLNNSVVHCIHTLLQVFFWSPHALYSMRSCH